MLCTVAPGPNHQVSVAGRSGDLGKLLNLPNDHSLLTTTYRPYAIP